MNKVLIYDADCPLCRAYTKGLVVAGTLPAEARKPSTFLTDEAQIGQLDPVRRRHEIPLLDLETGETRYGVDAILTILGESWPRFTRFIRETVLFDLARRFYAFISYNRRIIFPVPAERCHIMDLTPDFNAAHRLIFLLVLYGSLLVSHLVAVEHLDSLVLAALVGQIAVTQLYIVRHSTQTRLANVLDYMGHLGMSMLVGGLVKATGAALNVPELLLVGNAIMIWQHITRLRVMQLPDYLNLPFVAFVLLNH